MTKELQAQVQQLGLSERVIMPGRIPHDRIAGIYALIDINEPTSLANLDELVKSRFSSFLVIPAKAGIQYIQ